MTVDAFEQMRRASGDRTFKFKTIRGSSPSTGVIDETSLGADPAGRLSINVVDGTAGGVIRFRYDERLSVDLTSDSELVINAAIDVEPALIEHFVADQVVPRAMAGEGHYILHSATIRIGDRSIMILGASGRGKSTLAASFHAAGGALLGDDATIVTWPDERPASCPVYKSLRLLPDSIDALLPRSTATVAVSDLTSKRRVMLPADGSPSDDTLPIAAIFHIGEPTTDSTIDIRPMTVGEACMALVENAFACNPADIGQARLRLEKASRLARVPCFAMSYPRDYHSLGPVRAAMLDQL